MGRRIRRAILTPLLMLIAAQCCAAQDAPSALLHGEEHEGSTLEVQPALSAPVHRFWDRENILLFSGVAVMRGLDYTSTRNFQARGRKEILLPSDIVNNSEAFAGIEAAGTVTSVGISYIFHRTGHHSLERWMSIGHISVTAFGDVRNYCLKSKHHSALGPSTD